MLKGQITRPVMLLMAVIIISISGIIIIWNISGPSLPTSLEGQSLFVAHSIASYISGLSTVEKGKVEKLLNGTFDIEIGKYPWSKRTFTSIKPLGNYYVKVTAYDEQGNRKRDSGQVPFVGDLSISCGGTGAFKATVCEIFRNVSVITILKESNKPVELITTKTFTISPVSLTNLAISRYSKYKGRIEEGLKIYDLSPYYDNPKALVAGLITQESAGNSWDPLSVSPCGAAGLMQFIPATARSYGLKVPKYPFVECRMDICGKMVSSCNACDPTQCKSPDEDERFDPDKAIIAGIHLLYDNILKCGSVEGGLRMYNSGKCNVEANPGYVSSVLSYAEEWKKYV